MQSNQGNLRVELIEPLIVYRRMTAIVVVAVMGLVFLLKLLSSPNYVAAAVVSPPPRNSSTPDGNSRLGGLAGIAGVSLNSDQSSQNFDRFMYLTSSPELARWLINNTDTAELYYPDWDSRKHAWREPTNAIQRLKQRLFGLPKPPNPYSIGILLEDHVGVRKIPSPDVNKLISNIYVITYTDNNEARAAAILRYIVDGSNEILRSQAATRASRQAAYLQGKLDTTPTQEYRETLMRLFSEQEQALMLTSSHLPYAAEPLGDGYMPPRRAPKRIVMMTLVCGAVAFSLAYFLAIVLFNLKAAKEH